MCLDISPIDGSAIRLQHLYFVDLAGFENEKTTLVTGERMRELSFINTSLFELARCIQALSAPGHRKKRRKSDMSLFRSSKLTLLLSNSLTGNSRTSMIGTLSPAAAMMEGNAKTLMFANNVRNIKLDVRVVDACEDLMRLKEEVNRLKAVSVGLKVRSRRLR